MRQSLTSFSQIANWMFKNRRVTPCAVKTCAVRPVFARVVGKLRAADPSKCPRAHQAKMLAQGNNLRLRDEGGSWGGSSTQDQKPGQSAHVGSTQGVLF